MSRLEKLAKRRTEKRTYVIEGEDYVLNGLEKALGLMEFLGNVGASRDVTVYIDGDGATQFKITRVNKENKKIEMESIEDMSSLTETGKDIRVNID